MQRKKNDELSLFSPPPSSGCRRRDKEKQLLCSSPLLLLRHFPLIIKGATGKIAPLPTRACGTGTGTDSGGGNRPPAEMRQPESSLFLQAGKSVCALIFSANGRKYLPFISFLFFLLSSGYTRPRIVEKAIVLFLPTTLAEEKWLLLMQSTITQTHR